MTRRAALQLLGLSAIPALAYEPDPSFYAPFSATPLPAGKRLAIVFGHNRSDGGAHSAFLGQSEFEYYSTTWKPMLLDRAVKVPGLEVQTFERPSGYRYSAEISRAYAKVSQWNPDLVLELHFNASSAGRASGTETLHLAKSVKSRSLAQALQSAACAALKRSGRNDRGPKPVGKGGRGYQSLVALPQPTVILEPTFAGDTHDEAHLLNLNKEALCDAWLATAYGWANSNLS